jgi:hypothetical protein
MASSGTDPGPASGDDHRDPHADDDALAVAVPDDARELDGDVLAYHRELRLARRRAQVDRVFLLRRLRPYGLTGPLVVVVLGLVVSVTALFLALGPGGSRSPRQEPLAEPLAHVGEIDGLIPDAARGVDGSTRFARTLRPAVLALVPAPCGCPDVLDNLAHQSAQFGLRLYVVGPSSIDPEIDKLVSGVHSGHAVPAADPSGTLTKAYAAHGVTVVLLRSDGVVRAVVRDATAGTLLGTRLAGLDRLAG